MSYVKRLKVKSTIDVLQTDKLDTVVPVLLTDPWMDKFWKAFADERYLLMIHILDCKYRQSTVCIRWFDKIPFFTARELYVMIAQHTKYEYRLIVGWIIGLFIQLLESMKIVKAIEHCQKVVEALDLVVGQSPFTNKETLLCLSHLNLYDRQQNTAITLIIKQKQQIDFNCDYLVHDRVINKNKVIERVDSRADSRVVGIGNKTGVQTKKLIHFKKSGISEFEGDGVCFDVCEYNDLIYYAVITGFRKENNEIKVIQEFDFLILKNYHSRPFSNLKFSNLTHFLVTADMSYDIALWNYLDGSCLAVWKFHSRIINDLICTEKTVKIYTCSSDNSIRTFKIPQAISSMTFTSGKRKTHSRHHKLVFSLNYPSNSAFCSEPISSISLGTLKKDVCVFSAASYAIRIYKDRDLTLLFVIPINDFKFTYILFM